jgi:hypothetical protein
MRPDLKKLLAKGESETVEYKRSTGELREDREMGARHKPSDRHVP